MRAAEIRKLPVNGHDIAESGEQQYILNTMGAGRDQSTAGIANVLMRELAAQIAELNERQEIPGTHLYGIIYGTRECRLRAFTAADALTIFRAREPGWLGNSISVRVFPNQNESEGDGPYQP